MERQAFIGVEPTQGELDTLARTTADLAASLFGSVRMARLDEWARPEHWYQVEFIYNPSDPWPERRASAIDELHRKARDLKVETFFKHAPSLFQRTEAFDGPFRVVVARSIRGYVVSIDFMGSSNA